MVTTQSAASKEELLPVGASPTTLETPMWRADQNVSSTLTVQQTSSAETFTALTHVQVFVAAMPIARLQIICPSVSATKGTLEIPSLPAEDRPRLQLNLLRWTLVIRTRVDPTLCRPDDLETDANVLACQT